MAATHYVLEKPFFVKTEPTKGSEIQEYIKTHAVRHSEKKTLCGEKINGGERGRDILWYGQINCGTCRKLFATTPGRSTGEHQSEEVKPMLVVDRGEWLESRPLEEYLEGLFDIGIERRMRTAVFVQALYPDLTLKEALEKLRDPEFLFSLITALTAYERELGENGEESIRKVKALFTSDLPYGDAKEE